MLYVAVYLCDLYVVLHVLIILLSAVYREFGCVVFFFQAEDGIRDLVRSRGLGDVYKRQGHHPYAINLVPLVARLRLIARAVQQHLEERDTFVLSLIHI